MLIPHCLVSLGTVIHNVLATQIIFASLLPIVCVMSMVHLVCPVPVTYHLCDGASPSSGSSVGLAGIGVREES